ncbi:sugar ABC transporter permease [Spirochaetia bacterium]|nr:sugar ABC transporter permease [Spirochaetia bacterium]
MSDSSRSIRLDRGTKQPFWNSLKVVPYLFILPNMILFLVFMIIPIFMTGWYSLVRWNGMGTPKFIGLTNYFYIFQDGVFLKSLWNTLAFTGVTVPILMALALAFAIMLNQNINLRGFFRGAMYVPSIISTVVAGMVFIWLFDPQLGLINYVIRVAGGTTVEWSTDPRYAMVMIIVGTIWGRTGYNMVIYLAALQGIPPEYYEAAKIDGASPWQSFRHITMPMLNATHMFVLITCVIHSFRSFDLIYVMTKGGPLNATKTLVVYVYDTAFAMNNFGRASAAGVVLFFMLLGFTIVRMRSERTAL